MRALIASLIALLAVAACTSVGADPRTIPPIVHPHASGATAPAESEELETFAIGQPYTDAEFWEGIVPGGDNVEHYDTLADMTRTADVVVVRRITGIRKDPDRYAGVDLQGAMYATLNVTIDQVVAGNINEDGPKQLDLAIFMTDPRQYDRFAARLPRERALLFLRNSLVEANRAGQPALPGDDHYYRVASNQGALVDTPSGTQSASALDPFLKAIAGQPSTRSFRKWPATDLLTPRTANERAGAAPSSNSDDASRVPHRR